MIATSAGSESIIDLGRITRLRLGPETEFKLDFSRTYISGTLGNGVVSGFIPAGLPVTIKTAGGELVTDPNQPAEFRLEVFGEITKVLVKHGRVELRTENKFNPVGAGEVFSNAGPQNRPNDDDDDEDGLSTGAKVGMFAAIGGAATLLFIVLRGRNDQEPVFGDCVIILSGPSTGICT